MSIQLQNAKPSIEDKEPPAAAGVAEATIAETPSTPASAGGSVTPVVDFAS